MPYLTFHVKEDSWYYRYTLRKFLESFFLSKALIYKYELHQALRLNGKVAKLYQLLKAGDTLEVDLTFYPSTLPISVNKPITLLYEDEDILIVHKPRGVLVHTDGVSNDTLTNYVRYEAEQKNYHTPILPAHRLDVDTSGVLLFGKHPLAQSYLSSLFETHAIKKVYHAWVEGKFKDQEGRIDLPIGKDRHSSKQRVTSSGKNAVTWYKVLETKGDKTRIEITIEGGRKHQIRVHFAHIHHPVVGDELYGTKHQGLMLHAYSLSFIHPRTHEPFSVTCNAPF